MARSEHQAKCGKCKVALEVVTNDNGKKTASCPRCGNSDTVDNVHRIIGEYVEEQMALAVHQSLVDGSRGSKFLQVTSSRPPKRNHRFIVDLDL